MHYISRATRRCKRNRQETCNGVVFVLVRYSHAMLRQGKDFFREDLSKWHGLPRKRLIRTGFHDTYDVKWRGSVQNQRFNVDQSPLSFTTDNNHT